MLSISTPGRICLFGEHQDYLGLPVIAIAISLRCIIKGQTNNNNNKIIINKPDINQKEIFQLNDLNYSKLRDYFKSAINICQNEGLVFSNGIECELKSKIPIQSGISSSSAIIVSWIHFLSKIADNPPSWSNEKLGELAYNSEVLEFSEPGGMMDQYSTAIGGMIYLESNPKIKIEKLENSLGTFVIGDSKQPKNTMEILSRCKNNRLNIIKKLKKLDNNFHLNKIKLHSIKKYNLSNEELSLLNATLKNRNFLLSSKK